MPKRAGRDTIGFHQKLRFAVLQVVDLRFRIAASGKLKRQVMFSIIICALGVPDGTLGNPCRAMVGVDLHEISGSASDGNSQINGMHV